MSKKQMSSDEKLDAAISLIKQQIKPDGSVCNPVSLIQRHLLLGYTEAKSIIEEIKERGILND